MQPEKIFGDRIEWRLEPFFKNGVRPSPGAAMWKSGRGNGLRMRWPAPNPPARDLSEFGVRRRDLAEYLFSVGQASCLSLTFLRMKMETGGTPVLRLRSTGLRQ